MPVYAARLMSALTLLSAAAPATAADALFRSSFESSICDQYSYAVESNDTVATYDAVVLDASKSAIVCGMLNPIDNVDYFRITVASTSTALIETLVADGVSCPGGLLSVTVYDAAVSPIATNAGGGSGGCASLDGFNSPALQNLAPGNYYIRVTQSVFDPTGTPPYALDIRLF